MYCKAVALTMVSYAALYHSCVQFSCCLDSTVVGGLHVMMMMGVWRGSSWRRRSPWPWPRVGPPALSVGPWWCVVQGEKLGNGDGNSEKGIGEHHLSPLWSQCWCCRLVSLPQMWTLSSHHPLEGEEPTRRPLKVRQTWIVTACKLSELCLPGF